MFATIPGQIISIRRPKRLELHLLLGLLLCLLALGSRPVRGEEVDRLLAAVNGKVITEGDLVLVRSLNAVISGAAVGAGYDDSQAIERLIDLELMRQQLKDFNLGRQDDARVQARIQALRNAYAQKGGIGEVLRRFGLQESELISYLELESAIEAFIDFRFRPFASVSQEEISSYYQGRFAEQLRASGLSLPPFEQVASQIEEIVREEKINAMLDQWIREMRRNSRIEYFGQAPKPE